MRDLTLLRAFEETPWAILEVKLAQIRDVLELHASGVKLTPEEIEARIGPAAANRPTATRAGAVAVVPVYGVISQRMNMMSQMSGGTSTEKLAADIRGLVADPGVKAIVLNVDSPGGSVFGVPELAAEIRKARESKHIVAVANSMAASAAYWIAAQADEIVVTPSGQVGSIGVFTEHVDVSGAMEREGVKSTLISAGKYKTEANPYEPLNDEARAALQAMVDDYYVAFIGDVAAGRKTSRAAVRSGYGQGRMVNAQAAVAAGMADRVATLDQVIAKLGGSKQAAGPVAEAVTDTFKAGGEVAETIAQVVQDAQELAAQAAEQNAAARRRWLELERLR
jgi:signal peptide peptidase SppA